MSPALVWTGAYAGVMGLSPKEWHERKHVWANGYLPPYSECWECQRQTSICKTKRVYQTFVEAYHAALEVNISKEWHYQLVRPYYCRYCDRYHLKSGRTNDDRRKIEQQRRKWLRGRTQTERPSEREPEQELELGRNQT